MSERGYRCVELPGGLPENVGEVRQGFDEEEEVCGRRERLRGGGGDAGPAPNSDRGTSTSKAPA